MQGYVTFALSWWLSVLNWLWFYPKTSLPFGTALALPSWAWFSSKHVAMGNDEIEVFMSHEAVSKNMGIMWYPLNQWLIIILFEYPSMRKTSQFSYGTLSTLMAIPANDIRNRPSSRSDTAGLSPWAISTGVQRRPIWRPGPPISHVGLASLGFQAWKTTVFCGGAEVDM